MIFKQKMLKTPEIFCFLVLLISLWGNVELYPQIEKVRLIRETVTQETSFPLVMKSQKGERFDVEFDIESRFAEYNLKIIPDDCAERVVINGNVVDLEHVENHCNFAKGFLLPDSVIAPYRSGERNHYSFSLINNGGDAGLNVFVLQTSLTQYILQALAIVSLALLCFTIALRLGLGWKAAFLILVAVIIRATFFLNVSYKTFSYDVEGHLGYVQYLIENHSLPGSDDCWSCYHPPLYYVSAIPSFVVAECLGVPGTTGLQFFSLLLSVLTLFLGVSFLKGFVYGKEFDVALLLWIFWPTMILVSPRIGNDQLFYMLHLLCMWGGINYVNKNANKYLVVAFFSTLLAMWTKTTAVVTLGAYVLFVFWGLGRSAKHFKIARSSELLVCGTIFVLGFVFVLQCLLFHSDIVGNSERLADWLKVGNEAFNYLYFDLKTYMTNPFTSSWSDEQGRVFFWNFLLKTALFGEFELSQSAVGRNLATMMSFSLLGLFACAARGFWSAKLHMAHWVLLLQGMAFVAALMLLRILHPYSCSNDCRYILPVVICFTPFVARGIVDECASVKWKVFGYSFVTTFIVSTMLLYVLIL